MCENATQVLFISVMVTMTVIGAYCAHHLDSSRPFWVRLVVIAPAIVGMFAPVVILMGVYVPYAFDVVFAATTALLYAMVASRFSDTPWLDICAS